MVVAVVVVVEGGAQGGAKEAGKDSARANFSTAELSKDLLITWPPSLQVRPALRDLGKKNQRLCTFCAFCQGLGKGVR